MNGSAASRMYLVSDAARKRIAEAVSKLPVSKDRPLCIRIEEYEAHRLAVHNGRLWGVLNTISESVWPEGLKFGVRVWHEYFKPLYMPDLGHPEYDRMTLPGYRKWTRDASGVMVLTASTTQMTAYGVHAYTESIIAHAAYHFGTRFE